MNNEVKEIKDAYKKQFDLKTRLKANKDVLSCLYSEIEALEEEIAEITSRCYDTEDDIDEIENSLKEVEVFIEQMKDLYEKDGYVTPDIRHALYGTDSKTIKIKFE